VTRAGRGGIPCSGVLGSRVVNSLSHTAPGPRSRHARGWSSRRDPRRHGRPTVCILPKEADIDAEVIITGSGYGQQPARRGGGPTSATESGSMTQCASYDPRHIYAPIRRQRVHQRSAANPGRAMGKCDAPDRTAARGFDRPDVAYGRGHYLINRTSTTWNGVLRISGTGRI